MVWCINSIVSATWWKHLFPKGDPIPAHLLSPVYHPIQSLGRTEPLRRHLRGDGIYRLGAIAFSLSEQKGYPSVGGPPSREPQALHNLTNLVPLTSVSLSSLPRNILFLLMGTCSEKRYSSDRCFTNI